MLLCGFEKFGNFFVRIDILERLFLMIINSNIKNEIKLTPEILNLLGCSKENFLKLINYMGYKSFEKDNETFFKYISKRKIYKSNKTNKLKSDNVFGVLKNINFK